MAFLLSVVASLGSSVFPALVAFFVSLVSIILQNQYGAMAVSKYEGPGNGHFLVWVPNIQNFCIHSWHRKRRWHVLRMLLAECVLARSARVKIPQLMASIIFFLESVAFLGIISGTISLRMLIYRAFAPGLPGVGTAFYTA